MHGWIWIMALGWLSLVAAASPAHANRDRCQLFNGSVVVASSAQLGWVKLAEQTQRHVLTESPKQIIPITGHLFWYALDPKEGQPIKVVLAEQDGQRTIHRIDRAKPGALEEYRQHVERSSTPRSVVVTDDLSNESLSSQVARLLNHNAYSLTGAARGHLQFFRFDRRNFAISLGLRVQQHLMRTSNDSTMVGTLWTVIQVPPRDPLKVQFVLSSDKEHLTILSIERAKSYDLRAVYGEDAPEVLEAEAVPLIIPSQIQDQLKELDLFAPDVHRLFVRRQGRPVPMESAKSQFWFISTLDSTDTLFYVHYEQAETSTTVFHVAKATEAQTGAYLEATGLDDLEKLRLRRRFHLDVASSVQVQMAKYGLTLQNLMAAFEKFNGQPTKIEKDHFQISSRLRHVGKVTVRYKINRETNEWIVTGLDLPPVQVLDRGAHKAQLKASPMRVYERSNIVGDEPPAEIPDGYLPVRDQEDQLALLISAHARREMVRWQMRGHELLRAFDQQGSFLAQEGDRSAFFFEDDNGQTFRIEFSTTFAVPIVEQVRAQGFENLVAFGKPFGDLKGPGDRLSDQPFVLTALARENMKAIGARPSQLAELLWSQPELETIYEPGQDARYPEGLYALRGEVMTRLGSAQPLLVHLTHSMSEGTMVLSLRDPRNDTAIENIIPHFGVTNGLARFFKERALSKLTIQRYIERLFANRRSPVYRYDQKSYGMYDVYWFQTQNDEGEEELIKYSISPITQRIVILYVAGRKEWDTNRNLRVPNVGQLYFEMDNGGMLIIHAEARIRIEDQTGIQIHEIEEVLMNPQTYHDSLFLDKYVAIGETDSGRRLKVFYRELGHKQILVSGALRRDQ